MPSQRAPPAEPGHPVTTERTTRMRFTRLAPAVLGAGLVTTVAVAGAVAAPGAPASGRGAALQVAAPPAGPGLTVTIEQPPAGLDAEITGAALRCDAIDGEGLAVSTTNGVGVHPTLKQSDEIPFGPLAAVEVTPTREDGTGRILMVEGEGAEVRLDDPEGRSGTISGPYRITDGDGKTVTPAAGPEATFTWTCPA
jgi:hypothetical protein